MITRSKSVTGSQFDNVLDVLVESLETRRMLAGNVEVTVAGGALVITGDDASNSIVINQAGLGPGEFRVATGINPTTINGNQAPSVFTGVSGDIRIKFKGGNDGVDLIGAILPAQRDLRVDGGGGGGWVTLSGSKITGNVVIRNGAGYDTTEISACLIHGHVNVTNNKGGSQTEFKGNTYVGGNVTVRNGAQFDACSMLSSFIAGSVNIRNGSGGSDTTLGQLTVEQDFTLSNQAGTDDISINDTVVSGSTRIDNGHGDSGLIVFDFTAADNVTVTSRSGSDQVVLNTFSMERNLSINNGAGGSQVSLKSGNIEGITQVKNGTGGDATNLELMIFGKSATFSYGSGYNYTIVENSFAKQHLTFRVSDWQSVEITDLAVSGNLSVNATSGDAEIYHLRVDGNLSLGGLNTMNIDDADVLGSTSLVTTKDIDLVQIDDCDFQGAFSMKTLGGADSIEIERNGAVAGPKTTFANRVNVNMGSQNDGLWVGVSGQAGNSAVFNAMVRFNGGPGTDSADYLANGNSFVSDPIVTSV